MGGLTRPDAGDVRYDGGSYTELAEPARGVGAVLDARCMHPGRTARNHLRAMAALSGISPRRVDDVLSEVGLETAADQKAGGFSLAGVLSYVHGKNTDPQAPGSPGQQPLYNMMPVNAAVTLEHHLGNWSSAFALQAVDAKRDLQNVRMELHTPGYVLANLRTSYERKIAEPLSLRFDAGIDNLTARNYLLPLGGRYYGPTMAAIKAGTCVPGMGRNIHGGLSFQF